MAHLLDYKVVVHKYTLGLNETTFVIYFLLLCILILVILLPYIKKTILLLLLCFIAILCLYILFNFIFSMEALVFSFKSITIINSNLLEKQLETVFAIYNEQNEIFIEELASFYKGSFSSFAAAFFESQRLNIQQALLYDAQATPIMLGHQYSSRVISLFQEIIKLEGMQQVRLEFFLTKYLICLFKIFIFIPKMLWRFILEVMNDHEAWEQAKKQAFYDLYMQNGIRNENAPTGQNMNYYSYYSMRKRSVEEIIREKNETISHNTSSVYRRVYLIGAVLAEYPDTDLDGLDMLLGMILGDGF